MLCEEMDRLNIDVMGLAETYIKANPYTLRPTKRNKRTYKLYVSDCDDKGRKGVGFLICDKLDQRYKCSTRRTKCNWNQPGHGSKLRISDPSVHTRHISKKRRSRQVLRKS